MKNKLNVILDHFSSIDNYPIDEYDNYDCTSMLNDDNSLYCIIIEVNNEVRYITHENDNYIIYHDYNSQTRKCFNDITLSKNYKVIIAKMHNFIELNNF